MFYITLLVASILVAPATGVRGPSLDAPSAVCTPVGVLPDHACTPGAVGTTDLTIICKTLTGPRRIVSKATRKLVFAKYGIPWASRSGYEVDHLVPLEVGGSNDVENLWPEPHASSLVKDQVENRGHRLVCADHATAKIEDVQRDFEIDWRTVPEQ